MSWDVLLFGNHSLLVELKLFIFLPIIVLQVHWWGNFWLAIAKFLVLTTLFDCLENFGTKVISAIQNRRFEKMLMIQKCIVYGNIWKNFKNNKIKNDICIGFIFWENNICPINFLMFYNNTRLFLGNMNFENIYLNGR